jgi:hypothetical protein
MFGIPPSNGTPCPNNITLIQPEREREQNNGRALCSKPHRANGDPLGWLRASLSENNTPRRVQARAGWQGDYTGQAGAQLETTMRTLVSMNAQ